MILNGLHSLDNMESLLRCSRHATYTSHLNLRKNNKGVNLVPSATVHQSGIEKSRKNVIVIVEKCAIFGEGTF